MADRELLLGSEMLTGEAERACDALHELAQRLLTDGVPPVALWAAFGIVEERVYRAHHFFDMPQRPFVRDL